MRFISLHIYIYRYSIYIEYMGYPSPGTRSFFLNILYANHVVHFEDVRLVFLLILLIPNLDDQLGEI